MAILEMSYYSVALKQSVTLNVILPEINKYADGVGREDGEYKTLYLLHGLSGEFSHWLRYTSIERYAKKYNIAVVMPNVNRSWYTDTAYGINYFTFVTEELPLVCRSYFKGMSDKREDNFIAGLSMGGYGAVKAALVCPEVFGGCASLSGSLDITRRGRPYDLEEWRGIFGFDLESAAQLEGTKHDVFALTEQNKKDGKPFAKMFLWCGTEDSLISVNRNYRDLLCKLNIEHTYKESEGDHSWKYWDKHIVDALEFLFG